MVRATRTMIPTNAASTARVEPAIPTLTRGTAFTGVENPCPPPIVEGVVPPFTPIYDIQGSGHAGPIVERWLPPKAL